MVCYALSQIFGAWTAHSVLHSRDKTMRKVSKFTVPLLTGMSACWWNNKHGRHHMFTNSTRLDEDIDHTYSISMYPFLFLKWRKDSLLYSLGKFKVV